MKSYQRAFIEFAIHCNVLCFGDFTLKSGRRSPYFFNAGLFNHGAALQRLGQYYAQTLIEQHCEFDMLFGPAYKGIPLVSSVSIALATQYDRDLPFCFNRKESKSHGEKGILVGAPLQGRVCLVDDVITAGTAFFEAKGIIEDHGARSSTVILALDRQERGQGDQPILSQIRHDHGIDVQAIVTFNEVIEYLETHPTLHQHVSAMRAYQAQYA